MKKQIVAAAVLMSLATGAAFAQAAKEGPWMVRVRAVNLDMANKDGTNLGLSVNNKVIPEVDISYFFSKNVAAELVLTVPQKQDVRLNGANIGTFKHLPPTLLVQYHWDMGSYKPYVGAGVNYTKISSVNILGGAAKLESSSTGLALQAGVDIPMGNGMYFNFDVKKVQIRTDVFVGPANAGNLKLDPVLVGVGLGWRF
jgi:outer membrane protein